MTLQEKLRTIQKVTDLTQTKLAERLGVSFATFNSWWNSRSVPRPKMQAAIEALYLEATGQKSVSPAVLAEKKRSIAEKSGHYPSVIRTVLENPDIRDRLILKLTYNSNRIEGSTLTEPDTAAVLFDNVALPNRSLTEQLEAKNHQTAIQFLIEYVAGNGRLDEAFVLKLHSILMNGIRPDAGMYRSHGVRILGVNLPTANYLKIGSLIPDVLSDAVNQANDVVALAATVHSRFEQIHPFSDGNGRVGRLLMNAMLLQHNQAPAIIRQDRKQFYYASLYRAQTTEDSSRLEDFLCDAILGGFQILERGDE